MSDTTPPALRLLFARLARSRWAWRARRILRAAIRDGTVDLDSARQLLEEWRAGQAERRHRAREARLL